MLYLNVAWVTSALKAANEVHGAGLLVDIRLPYGHHANRAQSLMPVSQCVDLLVDAAVGVRLSVAGGGHGGGLHVFCGVLLQPGA